MPNSSIIKYIFIAILLTFINGCTTQIKENSITSVYIKDKNNKNTRYEISRINEDEENYYNLAIKIPDNYIYRAGSYSNNATMDSFILRDGSYQGWKSKFVLMRDKNEKSYVKNMEAYIKLRNRNFVHRMRPLDKKMKYNKSNLSDKFNSVDMMYKLSDGAAVIRIYEGKKYFWSIAFRTKISTYLPGSQRNLLSIMDRHCKIIKIKKSSITKEFTEIEQVRNILEQLSH